jgi:hypothetical protein
MVLAGALAHGGEQFADNLETTVSAKRNRVVDVGEDQKMIMNVLGRDVGEVPPAFADRKTGELQAREE